ncbi:MAG TPA: hypothetical protein DDW52_17150 [Planctomycetaceae bacterium]|nr:hypothetical protein [Planctomycetaceae bacterium]
MSIDPLLLSSLPAAATALRETGAAITTATQDFLSLFAEPNGDGTGPGEPESASIDQLLEQFRGYLKASGFEHELGLEINFSEAGPAFSGAGAATAADLASLAPDWIQQLEQAARQQTGSEVPVTIRLEDTGWQL